MNDRAHGTRSRYVTGCRCEPCRKANREYARIRDRQLRHPDVWGAATELIDAAEVREHLVALTNAGMGRRAIGIASGVAHSQVRELRSGVAKRCWPETARRLLAVSMATAPPGTRVDAAETWRLVDELVASGVRKYQLAHAIGQKGAGLQLSRIRVSKHHADLISQLHDALWPHRQELRDACRCYSRTVEAVSA